ncbi:MAG: BlaI/MecI/CopY family transcriptional regulator [Verrucomicrobiales bacterium]|nr:BlaI/MecI/CopY family transcriptional regulator [Verrucomicrobiales bacterium]
MGKKLNPTTAELKILQILWADGPSTVKHVRERLGTKSGYTGVLKQMQVMHANGMVERDESQRSHIYSAEHIRERTTEGLLRDLMQKAFGGSASKLVLSALSNEQVSKTELKEIRKLINRLEKQNEQD